jgi:hypothetical protein
MAFVVVVIVVVLSINMHESAVQLRRMSYHRFALCRGTETGHLPSSYHQSEGTRPEQGSKSGTLEQLRLGDCPS